MNLIPPTARRLRVLQILHGLSPAGAEQLVYEMSIANRPCLVTQVACLDHEGPLADELRAQGIGVHFTRRREGIDLNQIRCLSRLIGSFKPHVVHAHQYTPFFYGSLASLLAGRGKVLFTEHGRHFPDVVGWKRKAFNRFLSLRAAHVTAVCDFTRRRLVEREGIAAGKIEVVYNGVDVERFENRPGPAEARRRLGLGADARVIMQVGTFRPVKDQATALRAMCLVRKEDPLALLVFVGDGPDRPACERLARSLSLQQAVRFLGVRRDMPQVLSAADVFLLTSLSEAHSVSLLEAMACGLPIVATNVGGIPETVVDNETGLLAPAGDARAIARCLLRLLAQDDLRRRMGQAGLQRVRARFPRSRMHRRYMEIYCRLAAGEETA